MTSVSGNIGGTPSADGQKIFLQIPDSLLDTLTLSTTNENISFPELTVKGSIAFSSNGGDTAFESLNAGKAISIAVKSEDISGMILGSYDDFAVLSEVKKARAICREAKTAEKKCRMCPAITVMRILSLRRKNLRRRMKFLGPRNTECGTAFMRMTALPILNLQHTC